MSNITDFRVPPARAITAGAYATGGGSLAGDVTIGVDATPDNTESKVVARDASGNFAAGMITADLTGAVTGNASTATALQTARTINGVSFDGTDDITLDTVNKTGDQQMTGRLTIRSTAPVINLRDTNGDVAFLHCNGNKFSILRGPDDSTSWSQVNSQWPAQWNLTNNACTMGGSLTAVGNITAYSDLRLKTDIKQIEFALDKVCAIRGVTFRRTDDEINPDRVHAGVIAQEVEAVLPEVVETGADGMKTVAYGNMVGLLIESIRELKAEIDELKAGG